MKVEITKNNKLIIIPETDFEESFIKHKSIHSETNFSDHVILENKKR